jgi:hypothetical protein
MGSERLDAQDGKTIQRDGDTTLSLGSPFIPSPGWLDTGAPLSVVPFAVQTMGLAWQPLAGLRTTWSGQPCAVGYTDIWLTDMLSGSPGGPFRVLAKFPRSDPPGLSVPVLLGLEFLLAHRASLNLPPPPRQGTIHIP